MIEKDKGDGDASRMSFDFTQSVNKSKIFKFSNRSTNKLICWPTKLICRPSATH